MKRQAISLSAVFQLIQILDDERYRIECILLSQEMDEHVCDYQLLDMDYERTAQELQSIYEFDLKGVTNYPSYADLISQNRLKWSKPQA